MRGSSKRDAIAQFIPDGAEHAARVQATYEGFRRHLTALYEIGGVHAVDGAAEIFHWLRGQGIHIALTTGFDRRVTGLLLAALNWGPETVDVVVCGDDVKRGRPAPYLIFHAMESTTVTNVRQVLNVGDTALDLHSGYNAGVRWNIGVLTGAHGRDTLADAPHTHILGSVAELPSLWA